MNADKRGRGAPARRHERRVFKTPWKLTEARLKSSSSPAKCWRTSCIGGSFAAFFGAAPSICEECDSTFDGSTACAYGRCLSQHTCFHFGPSGHGWSFSGNEDARHVSLLLFVSPLCIFATALVTNQAAS